MPNVIKLNKWERKNKTVLIPLKRALAWVGENGASVTF
jgi:hypothetical protein